MSTLADKTLFISGASRGIGLAIALRAAADGANVAIAAKTDTPHPKLPGTIHTAADQIEAAGGKALPIVCDIRDEDQVEAAVKRAAEHFGGIDTCVNNASAISLTGTEETPMKRYDLMNQINARGSYLVSQKCIPYLKEAQKKGNNPHVLMLSPPLDMKPNCRKPEIVADAAHIILTKNARDFTGRFCMDDVLLHEHGVNDFDQYAVDASQDLWPDFFVPDDVPPPPGSMGNR